MICPRCNVTASAGNRFCVECGFDLRTAVTTCLACGAPFKSGDVFCAACGKRLGDKRVVEAVSAAEGTVLSHELIKEIASCYEFNTISPFSALDSAEKREKKGNLPVEGNLLDAILKPSKSFYLTASADNRLYQKILLGKDSTCFRWIDEDGRVVVNREKSPRDFIDYIYREISGGMSSNERSIVLLKREQILILKAINSLCQALSQTKLKTVFTTYDHLKQFLEADDGLKGQLDDLANDEMVRITGSGNPIITLGVKGDEIIKMLEEYDVFYTLQVLAEGREEFPSVTLTLRSSKLYMMSNPGNGDDVVVRTLDTANLRAVLNWMWTADLVQGEEASAVRASSVPSTPFGV